MDICLKYSNNEIRGIRNIWMIYWKPNWEITVSKNSLVRNYPKWIRNKVFWIIKVYEINLSGIQNGKTNLGILED